MQPYLFLGFYRPFRSITATTTCHQPSLSWANSFPLFTPKPNVNLMILSFLRYLCLSLGLFVSSFHPVANPTGPPDLHIYPAHLSLMLLRTPIMFVSPYNSVISWFVLNSNSPRAFLFGLNILLWTFLFKCNKFIFIGLCCCPRATSI